MSEKLEKENKKNVIKNLELKKPSELCQVLFYKDFHKGENASLLARTSRPNSSLKSYLP
jgi:hypothetical protein